MGADPHGLRGALYLRHARFRTPREEKKKDMTPAEQPNFCVLIPAYREQGRIGQVVEKARRYTPHVIVVDDGSDDRTAEEAEKAGAIILRHPVNRGKGAALRTGFDVVARQNVEFVITLDGDGQHDPEDIPAFVAAFQQQRHPVVVGNRMDHCEPMPRVRRWTNRFMSWLLSRRMGQRVPDTQSGFRLYRADILPYVSTESDRFAAESEVLLNMAARGLSIGSVPIRVIYRDEQSKIRPLRDTVRFFRMLHRHSRKSRARVLPSACAGGPPEKTPGQPS